MITSLIIALLVTVGVISFAEVFRKMDIALYASFNLAVIPFIYIGFSIDPYVLVYTIPGALFFLLFAYLGYKKHYMFTVSGLALHGLWDVWFPHASSAAPHGYDVFCITVDVLLALYFFVKLKRIKTNRIFG